MSQVTHDNHYVPQFYLKQWSEDSSHVWAYRLLVPNKKVWMWKKRSIKGTAFRKHLYTSIVDGKEVDDFEKLITERFELPAQDSIQRVIRNDSLSDEDWKNLIRYAMAQDLRTPSGFLEAKTRWENMLPTLLKKVLDSSVEEVLNLENENQPHNQNGETGFPYFNKTLKVKIHPDDADDDKLIIETEVPVGRALWLETNEYLLTNTINKLLDYKWSIIEPAQGYTWFTSDHPVTRLNLYQDGTYDFKGGWGKPGGYVFMPLSPNHLMFIRVGTVYPSRITAPLELTKAIQKFIAERAYRWIFTKHKDYDICKLRPREINKGKFEDEIIQWQKWHAEQSQSEIEHSSS